MTDLAGRALPHPSSDPDVDASPGMAPRRPGGVHAGEHGVGSLPAPWRRAMERRPPRPGPSWAPVGAFLATAAIYAISQGWLGRVPFGPRPSALNDLGAQFIPMTAHLWDLVHGQSISDAYFNWTVGMGHPFLADYATYLGSPLNLLAMALVRRDWVEIALTWVMITKLGLAAGFMTHLLRRLRPAGHPVIASALGAVYGTCGWAIDDGNFMPMWLDGLWGVPLLVLAGLWAREDRRPVLGILAVFVLWWSNFYTAYMATVAAIFILVLILLADRADRRTWGWTAVRVTWRTMVGGLLAGALLIPVALGASGVIYTDMANAGWYDPALYAARLFPLTEGVGLTPSLTFGTLPLLAAAALAVHPGLPRRIRTVWPVGMVALVSSIAIPPLMTAWHLGMAPNGSPWRQAFVVAALGVILAWITLTAPTPVPWRRVAALAAALLLVGVVTRRHEVAATVLTALSLWWAAGAAALAVLVALVAGRAAPAAHPAARGRERGRRGLRLAVAAGVAVMVAEQIVAAAHIVDLREGRLRGLYSWQAQNAKMNGRQASWRYDGSQWPFHRLTGVSTSAQLDGMLYGVPTISYSSSAAREDWGQALIGLGLPWYAKGRIVMALEDIGLEFLVGATGRMTRPGPITPIEALPAVRLLPPAPPPTGAPDRRDHRVNATPFAARNTLTAEPVYAVPELRASLDGRPVTLVEELPVPAGAGLRLQGGCPAGSTLQVYAPFFTGTWRQAGLPTFVPPQDSPASAEHRMGVLTDGVLPDGVVDVTFLATRDSLISPQTVGCLDRAAMRRELDAATVAERPAVTLRGRDIRVSYDAPQTGDLLITTALQAGWGCAADGAEVTPRARGGLMAIPLAGQRSVTCTFNPPYARLGRAVSGLAIALGAFGLLVRRWRRTRGLPSPA